MLTDAKIRSAAASDKPLRLTDGGGLYLEIVPAGGKWWRFKYRFGGKEKRLSLGTYPNTGLKAARDKAGECKKLLGAGVDPGEARKAEKAGRLLLAANSFEAIAREWLATVLARRVSEGHSKRTKIRLEQDVFPWRAHVFPCTRGQGRPMSDVTIGAALRRLGFPKEEMTGHGFRAMARTLLAERLGVDEAVIEAQLAHAVRDSLGRAYNRTTFLDQRRAMLQTWADYLDRLRLGAEVVALHAAR
jgi:integrase